MARPEIIPPGRRRGADDAAMAELRRLEQLADLLDSRFQIPGTDIRIGIDPLIGLLPAIGDGLSLAIGLYVVERARRIGVPRHLRVRMLVNLLADLGIGLVPVVGDVLDVGFKANRRNVAMIRRWLGLPARD